MEFNLWTFLLDNLEAAGAIGGYVSISVIGIALISYLTRKRFGDRSFFGSKHVHPAIGACLGVIPGCGGTIVASSLYKNRKLSFGGLFASFTATLGEGSFVLLGASSEADVAGNLKAFAIVTLIGLIVAIVVGYAADLLNLKVNPANVVLITEDHEEEPGAVHPALHLFKERIGFYLLLAIAVFLAPGSIMALWGGSIEAIAEATFWVGVAMTGVSIVYYLINRFVFEGHDHTHDDDLHSSLVHAVGDVALVVTYVFVGLLAANYLIDVVVGPETFDRWMNAAPLLVVVVAAFLGVLPGCGGMIAVAVAYITVPDFPIAALIAAAIATSGDGIFPLLAQNRREAFWVSLAGFVIAVLVGYGALAIAS